MIINVYTVHTHRRYSKDMDTAARGEQYMYTVTIQLHNTIQTLTNLPLERAIVYKRRWRKRGVEVSITKQECISGVCAVTWHPKHS